MSSQPPARPWFRLGSISRPQSAPVSAPGDVPVPAPAPQPQPSIIARPTIRPAAPSKEPTPTPAPGALVTAPTPPVISPPRPTPQPQIVTAQTPPQPLQQPARTTPAIRVPSVPSSPSLRPTAPTASIPQPFTTMRQPPPSPKKEVSPPQVARGILPTSTPARKNSLPKSASSASSSSSSSSAKSSPEVVKPAAQIPTFRLSAVPPSQIRAGDTETKIPPVAEQQKTMLGEKPRPAYDQPFQPSFARNSKQDVSRVVEGKEKAKGSVKKHSDSKDGLGMTIITIAGDNTGAVMDNVHSPKKHGSMEKPHFLFDKSSNVRHNMIRNDGSNSESSSSSSSKGKSKSKNGKSHKASNTKQALPMSAYINSNVQGINNAIGYNSACSHHDPGVHIALTKKPADGGFVIKERANVYHSD